MIQKPTPDLERFLAIVKGEAAAHDETYSRPPTESEAWNDLEEHLEFLEMQIDEREETESSRAASVIQLAIIAASCIRYAELMMRGLSDETLAKYRSES